MSRSLWQSLLGLITLGTLAPGCQRSQAPLPPTDVTLLVPAMN